jgi:hypothetical protein
MKKLLTQIIKEFWIQLIISSLWAIYKVRNDLTGQNEIITFITNFGASLFLTSWFIGQILRIKKQQKIESYLELVTHKVESLLNNLENSSNKIIDNITGGNSYLYMIIGNISPDNEWGEMIFIHKGENPVYDVFVEYIDLDEPILPTGNYKRNRFEIGTKAPKTASTGPKIKLNKAQGLRINVFYSTRRGIINQGLRMIFRNDKWISAYKVSDYDNLNEINIPDDFPMEDGDEELKAWKIHLDQMAST